MPVYCKGEGVGAPRHMGLAVVKTLMKDQAPNYTALELLSKDFERAQKTHTKDPTKHDL